MPLTPYTKLGPYEIIAPLGAGGKELYYKRENGLMAVSIEANDEHFAVGVPRRLFEFPPGRRFERDMPSFDIMPDGNRFVMLRSTAPGGGRRQINVVLNWSQELQSRVPAGRR